MEYKVKYIAQLCNSETDEVIEEQHLKTKLLPFPKTFKEFGLRHKEQVELIKHSQDFALKYQCKQFDGINKCPHCGKKLRKQGVFESEFHDVLTDHQVHIQRLSCTCGWKNKYTISGVYGSATHPELLKLQVTLGSQQSFDKAATILNNLSGGKRKINNDVTLMRNVSKVGSLLEAHKKSAAWRYSEEEASEIVLTTDGGHVQHREEGKHSFEELISTAYRPEDVIYRSNNRRELAHKVCVASAKSDRQSSIKKLTKNACKKLGMTKSTQVTALTDGAKNCWSVVGSLEPECKEVIKILDWFHIGKKFKERESKIPEELNKKYTKAKWHCWHGHPQTAIIRLQQIKKELRHKISLDKIDELIRYIKNNSEMIINYHARRLHGLPYTSQLAESSVNSVINDRQKNKKMQWTRGGAHHVLQIRTSLFSKSWEDDWLETEEQLYKKAA